MLAKSMKNQSGKAHFAKGWVEGELYRLIVNCRDDPLFRETILGVTGSVQAWNKKSLVLKASPVFHVIFVENTR